MGKSYKYLMSFGNKQSRNLKILMMYWHFKNRSLIVPHDYALRKIR